MTFVNSLSQIPSEKQVWKKLRQIVFGKKVKCPDCGRQSYVKEIQKDKMFRCTKCHNRFSVTNANWLKGMKISGKHLLALIWCLQKRMNVQQTRELIGLSIPTIRRYYELFRDNLDLDFDVILRAKYKWMKCSLRAHLLWALKTLYERK